MEEEEHTTGGIGKERRVESLGWLTESSVMPKKKRVIEGVGASSMVELRAQLYRTQEDVKRVKDGDPDAVLHRSHKKTDSLSQKNSGVEERARRDKLQLKAVTDGSASYAALERKAQLYEKLVRGELSDEDDRERYSVDFLRKGLLEDEFRDLEKEGQEGSLPVDNAVDGPQESSLTDKRSGIGWNPDKVAAANREHKLLVRQVNVETTEAREQAILLKQRREMQAQKNREKLKQAFLKKKLEKLKAAERKQKASEVEDDTQAEQHLEQGS